MGPGEQEVEELYSRYAPMVHRRARRLLGNEGDAWDAVHDVFVRLIERRWTEAEVQHPVTFIHRVTTNHCLNKLRMARRASRRTEAVGQARWAGGGADGPGDQQVDARDFVERLVAALGSRTRAAETAVYRYVDDMTLEEVAEVLQVSRKTVQRDLEWIEGVAAKLGTPGREQT